LLQLLDDSPKHNINQIQGHDITSETQLEGKNSWILDTGATDHVTYNKRNFITFYKIKPVNINLPNGSSIKACHAGTVQFSNDLIIFNVLYILEFSFNIIFVHRLIEDINYKLTFYSKYC